MTFATFTGRHALAVLVAFVVLRYLTIGGSNDPQLHAAIRAQIANDRADALEVSGIPHDGDPAWVRRIELRADHTAIDVLETSVSRPLTSFGGHADLVVRIRYRVERGPEQLAFWEMSRGLTGAWSFDRQVSAIGYYLNFL